MTSLHSFGLVRFSKKTGKIDTTMVSLGSGLLGMWALQNTTKSKACVLLDLDSRSAYREYIGTADGFPEVRKDPEQFEYQLPDALYDELTEENQKREAAARMR